LKGEGRGGREGELKRQLEFFSSVEFFPYLFLSLPLSLFSFSSSSSSSSSPWLFPLKGRRLFFL